MKRFIFAMLIVVPLLFVMYLGCSFGEKYLSGEPEEIVGSPYPAAPMQKRAPMAMRAGPAMEMADVTEEVSGISITERKVIYTANVKIEVESCDQSIEKIKSIVERVKGVVTDTSITEHDEGRKTAEVVVRVPSEKFEGILEELSGLGKVKYQDTHGADITEEYVDLEARLTNAKRMETRLVDLLENKSKSLKDMLDVEKELGRVRENIERMEGKKRYYDERVAMSTITINLIEPYKYTTSIFDPIEKALDNAGELFMKSAGAVLLFVAAALPWAVLVAIVVFVVVFFIKRSVRKMKKGKKKKGKMEEGLPKMLGDEEEEDL